MALEFFTDTSSQRVYSLDDKRLTLLSELLLHYYYRTGAQIDVNGTGRLQIENLRTLLQVIDEYKVSADLNRNREKAAAILGMTSLLQFCVDNNIGLRYEGH